MPAPPTTLSHTPLVAHGTVSYNGVTFPANSKNDSRGRPQYGSSGRPIVAIIYTITITCWIDADATSTPNKYSTDAAMQGLRQALETPAAELHLDGVGWG